MKHTLTILVVTLLLAVIHPTTTHAQRWLSYEPQTVELDGRLVIQSRYGPPNYGEDPKTDEKVRVPILVLKNGVSVLPGQEVGYYPAVYRTTRIQLAFIDSGITYRNLIGQNVVVTGSLFHAHTGHHYTDVVLKVNSIERRTTAYAQRRFDVCSIVTSELNHRQRYATSNSIFNEFLAIVGEEKTERSFKHPESGLIVNAAVKYVDLDTRQPRIPAKIRIALSVSKQEEDAFEAEDIAEAGTNYKPGWGALYVKKRAVAGDIEHTFTLHCSDGSTRRNR